MVATHDIKVNGPRLLARLRQFGELGKTPSGGVARLALTDEDKQARDLLVSSLVQAGLDVSIDEVGNILGCRTGSHDLQPIMSGSHLDTVRDGGRLDGAYGVLAALEVVESLNDHGVKTKRPLAIADFTNEEGARFQPDMMGSLAYAGGVSVDAVLACTDRHGVSIGSELERIGYAGNLPCGSIEPEAFVELHIEQGPVLEQDGAVIGAVEDLQGISWSEILITGQANHAGTTPMRLRHDAGYCAGAIIEYLRSLTIRLGGGQVATAGTVEFTPNVINVVPGSARITVDLRNTDSAALLEAERCLEAHLQQLCAEEGTEFSVERLARFDPVRFSPAIAGVIERQAAALGLSCRRMTSGAGHDAQMMSRICDTAMIFVPSKNGISHNPDEHTDPDHLIAGANVLLRTMLELSDR